MSYLKCEESAAGLVMNLFIGNTGARHTYHNLLHTIKVVGHVKEIAAFYQVGESELCMLLMAAWFHDVGWLFDETGQPERTSIVIMKGFLQANNVDADVIDRACNCIQATVSHPHFASLAEKIMCDAVTYDYGTSYFKEYDFNPASEALDLLNHHVYYTEYCQLKLRSGKIDNIAWAQALL